MVMLLSSSYPGRQYSFVTSALLVVVVALSCFGSIAFADTYTFNNFQVDRNYSFFFDDFWFTKDQGQLLLNVSDISFSNPNPASFNLSQLGFFLLSRNYSTHHYDYMYTACSLHSHHIPSKILYTFDNLVQPSSSPNKNLTTKTSFDILITDVDADDVYDLYLQNCISPRGELTLSMTVRISMYNFDPKTGHKSYLSSTKSLFPRLYLLCILVYFSLGCLWACFLYKKIQNVCRIHVSMLIVVILKALSSLLELMNVYYLSVTGCAQCSTCVVLTYMSEFLNGTPLITLMILIFIGWSYMKPSLSHCEITMLVLLVCFRAAVIYWKTIGLGARGTSPFFRSLWASVFTLIDSQLVVFLLVSAISSVVMFLHDARKAHGKATLIFKRVKQFRLLFIVFVLNCVYNNALCRLEFSAKPTQYLWSFVALKEIGTVILYVFIGYLFRPDGVMLSMPITDDEEKAAYESLNTSPARYLQYMTGFKAQLPEP